MRFSSQHLKMFGLLLALGGVAVLAGCSKKTPVADQTQQTPGPGGDDKTPDENQGNPATGGDVVESDDEDGDIRDVYFDYDDYSLTAEARSRLSGNASYLKEMSRIRVTIEGHCDERGTVEYNLALGQRRADAARNYLANLGIDADRMATISYGKERPFDPGHDETAWSKNRRAHFRVTNP